MNIHHKSVYYTQVILIYTLSLACILNLSLGTEPMTLWISLLSSSIAYLLPGPKLKTEKKVQEFDTESEK